MASRRPFDTDKFISYRDQGGERITCLSLAIWLVDDFTNNKPIDPVRVEIKNEKIKSIKNLSGYYIFTDLEEREYTVDIESAVYFHEQRTFDMSMIRTLEKLNLNFDTYGPRKKDTEVILGDVSKLQEGYVVEFYNYEGKTEQRSITSINKDENKIKWKKELELEFGEKNENLFIWENVPAEGDNTDESKLIKFLKDVINFDWVESAKIKKSADKKIITLSSDDHSVEIKLENDAKAVLKKIGEDRTHELMVKEEEGKHKVYGSIIRAQNYQVEIILKPAPSYPFPDHSTLVRGAIVDSMYNEISDVNVKLVEHEMENRSDERGEFVLYCGDIFNKKEENKKVEIEIEKNSRRKTVKTFLEMGKTKVLGKIVFP